MQHKKMDTSFSACHLSSIVLHSLGKGGSKFGLQNSTSPRKSWVDGL